MTARHYLAAAAIPILGIAFGEALFWADEKVTLWLLSFTAP